MKLWDFALAAWTKPGVCEVCLRLQDDHGQCIALLLWRAWSATEGRGAAPDQIQSAIDLARAWESGVLSHLRTARRWLDAGPGATEPLRAAVRETELAGEHALLEALETLTPASGAGGELVSDLTLLMGAWNGARAQNLARALVASLRLELPRGQALLN